jgi:DNA polymerase
MGLAPIWRLRGASDDVADHEVVDEAPPLAAPSLAIDTAAVLAGDGASGQVGANPLPVRPKVWTQSDAGVAARSPEATSVPRRAVTAASGDQARTARIATLGWNELEADIRACQACRLCERRKQAVPGVGDRQADWMLVGEGPGSEEDLRGEPFVGPAGKLLDAMLAAIGLKRGEGVYIANAVKCRPPHNRTPEADEIATCMPYLARQIELVRPRLLVALGRPAAHALLETEISIGASRGRIFHYGETPVVVTYHPAYLLRNQGDKTKAWEDLCFARRVMRESGGQS